MKKIFLFFAIFLIAPSVLADIIILTEQDVYNLGNKIRASASVMYKSDFDGLFKLTIACNDYQLQYYTTPVSLEANSRTAVDVPELTATSSMLGSCMLTGVLTTNNNLIIEEKSSNSFEVTHQLKVLPVNSNITALPSASITVAGIVNEAFGNNLLKADVKVVLDNLTYQTMALDGNFNVLIELPKNIKSGKHTIEITASDSKNNLGTGTIELEITPVPSHIRLELGEYNIDPGRKIGITASLYDQADDFINASLGLELLYENQEKIFTKTVQSNEKIEYEFSQYAKPGNYMLAANFGNLKVESLLNVTTLRKVKIVYDNQSVLVDNIGNVPFIDELTFIIQDKLRKYPITKKINIEPGKLTTIDLSKEVPEGIYNVLLEAAVDFTAPLSDRVNGGVNDASEEVLAEDAKIEDNRPMYRKIQSGLSSISANLVNADGLLTRNPLVAPTILTAVILLLVIRYGRKPIMRLIKREKKEPKEKED